MVYIYKKIIGGRPYYYLRASKKEGNKVISKDIAYLGNSIDDVKKALSNLSKYKEQIRKAYKTLHNFLQSNYYIERASKLKLKKDQFLGEKLIEVEACKIHYNAVFNKNDELTKKEILKNFIVEFAFNTTSIEGNTVNLEEARNLLENGLTPKNKTIREIYDLQNTEKVFLKIFDSKEDIVHEFITDVHKGLMENIDSRLGYRRMDVRVIRSNFDATPAPYVKTDMNLLIEWYKEQKNDLHPVVLATLFHHKFEKIHPFMDGNGRTGRMLLNFILIKNKCPPLVIHKKTREDYLKVLRIADISSPMSAKKEDYFHLVQFLADEMAHTYWSIFL